MLHPFLAEPPWLGAAWNPAIYKQSPATHHTFLGLYLHRAVNHEESFQASH